MKSRAILIELLLLIFTSALGAASYAYAPSESVGTSSPAGQSSINSMSNEWGLKNPECKYLCRPEDGGEDIRDSNDNPIPGFFNPATVTGAGPFGTLYPPTPAAAMGVPTESKVMEAMLRSNISGLGGFSGQVNSDLKSYEQQVQAANLIAKTVQFPGNAAQQAKAQQLSQGIGASNAMGEAAKAQSASAIDFCSKYLQNFTATDGNQWNQLRTNLFVPIGLLLILPGALLTQIRAMMASGNPTLGDYNPFDGILRAIVAVFFVPATYFVVNYGIDFSNSITSTIGSTYTSIFGSNMYKDALSAEIKAFPVRGPKENNNTGVADAWQQGQVQSRADYEKNFLENKIDDPASNTFDPQKQKVDEAMPSGAMAARMLSFVSNAGLTASWNILCAFQQAYLGYLFFVGPVVAGLWVWPVKAFREALPNWVEGVITICCWSLFWNTVILLMACFRGVDETGTTIMTALNFLSTASVKFAFDFSGLVRAAGAEATKAVSQGGGGAQGGKGGKHGAQHGTHGLQHGAKPGHTGHPSQPGGPHHTQPNHVDPNRDHQSTPMLGGKENSEKLANLPHSKGSPNEGGDLSCLGGSEPAHVSRMGSVHPSVEPPPLSALHRAGHMEGKQHESSFQLDSSHKLSLYTGKNGEITEASLRDQHGGVIASFNHDEIAAGAKKMLQGGQGVFAVVNEGGVMTFGARTPGGDTHALMVDKQGSVSLHDGDKEIMHGNLSDHPKVDSIALQGNSEGMFMDANGGQLFVRNGEGGYDAISVLPGEGRSVATLPDGRTVDFARTQDGSGYISTVSVMDGKGGVLESFAVTGNGSGLANIQSVDQHGEISNTGFSTNGTSSEYRHFDANDNVLQRDVVTADGGTSFYYNSDGSGSLVGSANWQSDGGTLCTTYQDSNGALLATAMHEVRADGSALDTVRDANNNLIASQEQYMNNNGTWSYEYCKYAEDGTVLSSQISAFPPSDGAVFNTAHNAEFAQNTDACIMQADYVQNFDASMVQNADFSQNIAPPSYVQNGDYVQNYDAGTISSFVQNVDFGQNIAPASFVQNADYVQNYDAGTIANPVQNVDFGQTFASQSYVQNADYVQNYAADTISSSVQNVDLGQNIPPSSYIQNGDYVQNYDAGTIASPVQNVDFGQNIAPANYVENADYVQSYDAGTIANSVQNVDFGQNIATTSYAQNADYVQNYDASTIANSVQNVDFGQNIASSSYVQNADYVQNYDASTIANSVQNVDFGQNIASSSYAQNADHVQNYDAGTIPNSLQNVDFGQNAPASYVQNADYVQNYDAGTIASSVQNIDYGQNIAPSSYVQNADYVQNYDAGSIAHSVQNVDYGQNIAPASYVQNYDAGTVSGNVHNAEYVQNVEYNNALRQSAMAESQQYKVAYNHALQQNAVAEAANYPHNADVHNYDAAATTNGQSIEYSGMVDHANEYSKEAITNPSEVEYMPMPYAQSRVRAPREEAKVVQAAENIVPVLADKVRPQVVPTHLQSPRKVDSVLPPSTNGEQKPAYVSLIHEFDEIAKKADTLNTKKLNQIIGKTKGTNC